MAISNQQRVEKGLTLLKQGLADYIQREFTSKYGKHAQEEAESFFKSERLKSNLPMKEWDAAALLHVMWEAWNDVFARTLGFAERTLVSELRNVRNDWAHQKQFSSDDTDRALDSINRLLTSISSPFAEEVSKMKLELRRLIFDEQLRNEKRKSGGSLIDSANTTLKPWRELVIPHVDVASGRYQQAEFAADLWEVHLGNGSQEYANPTEFFRRTYLTESLKGLLIGGLLRLNKKGGDPVVQLQTNFGGGKTHSMLALYHMCSGASAKDMPGMEVVMAAADVKELPKARRVVLVGNKISPGNPVTKSDGTVVRTIWGELAYQLGGKAAFDKIAEDDIRATNPGDRLRELFIEYGPCLILIDEWVAYARQLHDSSDLPGGDFDTQFSFAQALTESAKAANNCLLVVSLPASDTSGSPHTQVDEVEVGGIRGREALDRLRNVVGRIESSWRPATAEEGFEIVRRRLFEPLTDSTHYKLRDLTARAFVEAYQASPADFPPECRTIEYEKRIQAAFPIHPEIFDRLYSDWSTLAKFQRTRGVLRLMAAVIHSLWKKGDKNPLILPSTIPLDDPRVQAELTRYLSDNWTPIIEKDIDGPDSLPLKIDGEVANLGRLHATRRVARTIYLGSAPTSGAAHRGIEDRRIKLGCVIPGESPAIYGDALRRLSAAATYLYQDGNRAWYSTQPTVTKLADDRAEQYSREPDRIAAELDTRIRTDLKINGVFIRIHPFPRSGADVPDDYSTGLVVLPPEYPFSKDGENAAGAAAKSILELRGNAPRLYRNTLVFLAADKVRLTDLYEAVCKYLAWKAILEEKDELNLDPNQVRQAENQRQAVSSTVTARIPETYQWALVPEQQKPDSAIVYKHIRLSGNEPLAVRIVKKLRHDESLIFSMSSVILRKHLDDVPLWQGDHVSIRQLVEYFCRYLYLPRLNSADVLIQAIQDGLKSLTWRTDTFAYADAFDEASKRYKGIQAGQLVHLMVDSTGILVKPDVAAAQLEAEIASVNAGNGRPVEKAPVGVSPDPDPSGLFTPEPSDGAPPAEKLARRYYGTVTLDSTRVGLEASRIGEAVVAHLAGLDGAQVKITLEIEAYIPAGAPDHVVRIVTENGRTLKFGNQGFERE